MIIISSTFGGISGAMMESPARRCEMSIWMIPRTLDAFVNFLKRRGYNIDLKKFFVPMFLMAMASMNYGLETESSTVRFKGLFEKYYGIN
jgi:hypothetical protein